MAKRKPQQDDKEQSKRFEETARELEADETGELFERALDAALPAKPGAPIRPKEDDLR